MEIITGEQRKAAVERLVYRHARKLGADWAAAYATKSAHNAMDGGHSAWFALTRARDNLNFLASQGDRPASDETDPLER